jgi:hypothetical protein
LHTCWLKSEPAKKKINANLKETRASQELLKEEMLAKLDADHKSLIARMDSQLQKMSPTNGISTLSWWWGLRAPETLRAMPAVA